MNNIIKTIQKNKRILIVVLVVLLVAAASLRYVLKNKNADYNQNTSNITDNKNNKNSDEKKKDNKQKETTSTKDEKKPSVKEDNKSDDKKSEEVKTDVTETSTSVENTTSNNISNNTSTTTNNNATNTISNSTSNNNTSAPCVPTYTTVTHPAVGHYEQREIMPAYTKGVYAEKIVGGQKGRVYNSLDEWGAQDEDYSYSVQKVQVGTEYVPAEYDNVWVEDQPAYTTTEASGC